MNPSTFLSLYEKLEHLVQRLPSALQQPIMREITPVKTLFLLQRPPRLVLLGPGGTGKVALVNALFGGEALRPGEENLVDGGWREIGRAGRGTLRLLDARRPVALPVLRAALVAEAPDLLLFIHTGVPDEAAIGPELDHAEAVLAAMPTAAQGKPRLLALLSPGEPLKDAEGARQALNACLHTRLALSERMAGTLSMASAEEMARISELIAFELPGEAQLEMARLSGNRALQAQIARVVVKSVTAICAAIGAQPIPLADFPILTSLQATMVGGIMHISGQEWSPRLAGEFMAALGANVGAGLILREGARAAAKFIPVWGNAISGAVAGAGTYAIGRAAIAFFIEGVSLGNARQLFQRKKQRPEQLPG